MTERHPGLGCAVSLVQRAATRSNPRMVARLLSLVRFSQTIFALPFAVAAAAWAAPHHARALTWASGGFLLLCMVAARTCAMGANRLLDRKLDAANPRTANRELVTGAVSLRAAWGLTLGSGAAFIAGAAWFGPIVAMVAPVVLAILVGYSTAKRFTWLCHYWLGLSLGLAPVAVVVAMAAPNTFADAAAAAGAPFIALGIAVALWVAGFDILYALADEQHDRAAGIRSIPARFGTAGAFWISRATHALSLAAFAAAAWLRDGAMLDWIAVGLVGATLIVEHALVGPKDLRRLNHAFFTANGVIAVGYGTLQLFV
jgi:4-hydroxybenzoate polyprenyltransferase